MKIYSPVTGPQGGCAWLILGGLLALFVFAYLTGKIAF